MQVLAESPQAKIGLGVLGFFVLIAILAPWIAPYDIHTQVGPVYAPPSWKHPLGLDDGGIDMVSLLIHGGRVSLIVGFAATFVAMIIGGGIGILAGYFGGWARHRADADHGLLPRHPRPAPRDRRGRGLGREPAPT